MKFSTRATYGLRLCFILALSKTPLSAAQLVKKTDLSAKYIEQLLGMLKRGNIVTAYRGKAGGYELARAPEDITVGDMLVALDDAFEAPRCVDGSCDDMYCPNRNVLSALNKGINDVLGSITLDDMVSDIRKVCKET